ncbi:hypothetical protein PCASD_08176 [Puccinia coronata f. sp. avenae]|uniref:Uncharacterized protein n=1 Tax=Puccinia coronata f. sp. avenae TaxID=200324 RepID=A0A2N5VC59_9BASI|nr:hypothetical protein PCASD_21750 [Puccinia coronata f. sp. avenae]PLW47578.1 hypothetical protein PCASD_08176 [Puccinia coronata f. sp. avenae]
MPSTPHCRCQTPTPNQTPSGKSINKPGNCIPGPGQPRKTTIGRGKQPLRDDSVPTTTTFIPQITGSSAYNWRRTAHNPPPPPPPPPEGTPLPHAASSDTALILAEMKAQRDEEKLRRERNDI